MTGMDTVPDMPEPTEFHFEGPEKKLDMTFSASHNGGLRRVPEDLWTQVLTDAKCSILHRISNDTFDAFLLSESSLFVYPSRVIAKTCGQTTLLNLIPHLFAMASALGMKPLTLTYGHYRYKFPDEQLEPHRNFETERASLDKLFAGAQSATLAGSDPVVHEVASKGQERCWHLYAADLRRIEMDEVGGVPGSFPGFTVPAGVQALRDQAVADRDQGYATPPCSDDGEVEVAEAPERRALDGEVTGETVLEVAMEGLAPAFTRHFFYDGEAGAARAADPPAVARACGIAALLPGVDLDSWCFEPCGFSLNGQQGAYYYTIHITPEPQMSFASFETNDPCCSSHAFLSSLLDTFVPQDATVLVTARAGGDKVAAQDLLGLHAAGYKCARSAANQDLGSALVASCAVLDRA
mmetsp:Transcript_4028/g.11425  ORF Transcript_4028/g.11425 Transcript_4028/m.11425 type:complete len:409 (+) Transcript_4028:167-1393(+)